MSRDSTPFPLPLTPEELSSRLLPWYNRHRRLLPWRVNPTPYRVWLSEIMLQQTTVAVALDYYRRFLERFPTIETLAAASEDEVLALWAGLGYYSRARNLLRTARVITSNHGGRFPSEPSELASLPGIGRYTAGAVASVAFGKSAAILDGNVRRVFSRLLAFDGAWDHKNTRRLWVTLERLVQSLPESTPIGDFNQSLMELGALVCTPRSPSCESCPVAHGCVAFQAGLQHVIPKPATRPVAHERHLVLALVTRDNRFLMSRHESGLLPRSLWGFPEVPGKPDEDLAERFENGQGLRLSFGSMLGTVVHAMTHRRLHLHVISAVLTGSAPEKFLWVEPCDSSFGRSSYVEKVLRLVTQFRGHRT